MNFVSKNHSSTASLINQSYIPVIIDYFVAVHFSTKTRIIAATSSCISMQIKEWILITGNSNRVITENITTAILASSYRMFSSGRINNFVDSIILIIHTVVLLTEIKLMEGCVSGIIPPRTERKGVGKTRNRISNTDYIRILIKNVVINDSAHNIQVSNYTVTTPIFLIFERIVVNAYIGLKSKRRIISRYTQIDSSTSGTSKIEHKTSDSERSVGAVIGRIVRYEIAGSVTCDHCSIVGSTFQNYSFIDR